MARPYAARAFVASSSMHAYPSPGRLLGVTETCSLPLILTYENITNG